MAKKNLTAADIEQLINQFKDGEKDTRKVLAEVYYGISDDYSVDRNDDELTGLIEDFNEYVGEEDNEFNLADEKYRIGELVNTLKHCTKEQAEGILRHVQDGREDDLEWLDEDENFLIIYMSEAVLEFTIKKYIKEHF